MVEEKEKDKDVTGPGGRALKGKGALVTNRSKRTIHLGVDEEGNPRDLVPGQSIETLDEIETKTLLNYDGVVEAGDDDPDITRQIDAHKAEIERLENLQEQQKKTPDQIAKEQEAAAKKAQAKAEK